MFKHTVKNPQEIFRINEKNINKKFDIKETKWWPKFGIFERYQGLDLIQKNVKTRVLINEKIQNLKSYK